MSSGQKLRFSVPVLLLVFAMLACTLPGAQRSTLTSTANVSTYSAQTREAQLAAGISTSTPIILIPTLATSTSTIMIPTGSPTPTPTTTFTITPIPTQTELPCDLATFVTDVTVPDGMEFYPGDDFIKTWRLKNIGSCTWSAGYNVIFVDGDIMGAPLNVDLPGDVPPMQEVDVSVSLVAPDETGSYRGNWKLRNAEGVIFGLSTGGPFYVEIEVVEPAAPTVVYDFVSNYCSADWVSIATDPGTLACPGGTGDDAGFIVQLDNPKMEDGASAGVHAIETHPTWDINPSWDTNEAGGWIQGSYPAFLIQQGSHLKGRVGCQYDADTCDVNFYLYYQEESSGWIELGSWHEVYDGSMQDFDIDLATLVGHSIQFKLQVDANSHGGYDQAVWIYPRIEK
jgi:hypothetical protein